MLQKILSEFLQIEGVTTAALVRNDGFVIEFVTHEQIDNNKLAAISSEAAEKFSREWTRVGMGAVRQMTLEKTDGAIIVSRVTGDELLVIHTNSTLMPGRLNLMIPKISQRLAAAI